MMNDLQALRALPHVSVSQLKCYLGCPRQHAYRYTHKIAPAFRPVALSFGTAWHATIGHRLASHRAGVEMCNGELHDHLRDGIVREIHADGVPVLFDDDEDEGSLIDKAMQMLDAFVADVPMPERVLEIEMAFSLELYEPETGEVLPAPLIGAIDALVVEAGEPVIWEVKSGKRRWSQDQLAFDLQPSAYLLAAREQGFARAGMKLVLTTKATRPTVQIEPITRTTTDEDDLARIASGVLRAVAAGIDFPVRSWACKSCPYMAVCS